jgi:transcriptional regulator with XRE-family HTH domain
MSPSGNAAVSRRRLRTELKSLRLTADKTQKEIADALEWSPSKIMRIEGGRVGVTTTDLRALLTQYQVKDQDLVVKLTELARESRRSSLSNSYGDVYSQAFSDFLDYEEAAKIIRQFETKLVPGPLQTEDYARAVFRIYASATDSKEKIDRKIQARMSRKELLTQPDGPRAFFIIDEAALWRQVGAESDAKSVMAQQLDHLMEMNAYDNISIQVVPFSLGAYPAMRGPFVILDLDDEYLLYRENPDDEIVVRDNIEEIAPYLEKFSMMEKFATPADSLSRAIDIARAGPRL